jgi:methylmalonyl-CoA mutase N-terminal domain/subunit
MGGALAAIEQGYIQDEIQNAAYAFQQALERNEETVVGVNAFQVDEQVELERLKVDPAIEQNQRLRLSEVRARREAQRAAELLAQLENAARGGDNLMPVMIACVENDLTLGEICGGRAFVGNASHANILRYIIIDGKGFTHRPYLSCG